MVGVWFFFFFLLLRNNFNIRSIFKNVKSEINFSIKEGINSVYWWLFNFQFMLFFCSLVRMFMKEIGFVYVFLYMYKLYDGSNMCLIFIKFIYFFLGFKWISFFCVFWDMYEDELFFVCFVIFV